MSATTKNVTKPNLRTIISSSRLRGATIAVCAGIVLALAFPRAGLAWAAPIGAGALFWTWQRASWKRALWTGWLCGLVFFTITFWWWSTTIQTVVGPLAYLAVIVSAGIEALAIAAAGLMTSLARPRTPAWMLPVAAAAAFALTEWLRSIGTFGVPFGQLGTTQVQTLLRPLGAYVGTSGISFVVVALGAFGADAIARRTARPLLIALLVLAIGDVAAWYAWPARTVAAPVIPVAAVQGDISQSLKWQPGSLQRAVAIYTSLTLQAMRAHPQVIVWPETVIALNGQGLNQNLPLLGRFTTLAAEANATLVAGSIDVHGGRFYNALYFFTPRGLRGIYDKRQLVPFAEHFPGARYLWWLPYIGTLNGDFAEGTGNGVFPTRAGLRAGALICWESAFGDLAYAEVRDGAQFLIVSTDDAWFGTSSGPYQHAQIAQMRAIESGEYVVRSAATGISGVIAPDGSWQQRLGLDRAAVVSGFIGAPAPTIFDRLGPTRIWIALLALYLLAFALPRRRRS